MTLSRRFLFEDGTEYGVPLRAGIDLPLARQEHLEMQMLCGSLAEQLAAWEELCANIKRR
jgi:hypothetical protein